MMKCCKIEEMQKQQDKLLMLLIDNLLSILSLTVKKKNKEQLKELNKDKIEMNLKKWQSKLKCLIFNYKL